MKAQGQEAKVLVIPFRNFTLLVPKRRIFKILNKGMEQKLFYEK